MNIKTIIEDLAQYQMSKYKVNIYDEYYPDGGYRTYYFYPEDIKADEVVKHLETYAESVDILIYVFSYKGYNIKFIRHIDSWSESDCNEVRLVNILPVIKYEYKDIEGQTLE